VFSVEVARGTWPDTAKLREDLAAVLSDRMSIGERLSERERVYPLRRGSAAHLPGSDVSVDNDASETATVLEVRAPDEIGLLHRITASLFDMGMDSLMAVELAASIERRLGIELSALSLSDGPTLERVVDRIARQLHTDGASTAQDGEGELTERVRAVVARHASEMGAEFATEVGAALQTGPGAARSLTGAARR